MTDDKKTNTKELQFTVQGHKMNITVPWPVDVIDAETMYTERGLMEIIARGLQYYFRKKLEEAWKESTTAPARKDWNNEAHVEHALASAMDYTPPGTLPPSQAEIQFKAINELGERDRKELLGLLGITPQKPTEAAQVAPQQENALATAEEIAVAFSQLSKGMQRQCAQYIQEMKQAPKGEANAPAETE